MKIEIHITDLPLLFKPVVVPGCGAVVRFDGIVRGAEEGRTISALEYEAYEPMAKSVMRDILQTLHKTHPFSLARVHHRVGIVPVGEAAILVEVHSRHRAAALAVAGHFMDELKKEVPVWKRGAQFHDSARRETASINKRSLEDPSSRQ